MDKALKDTLAGLVFIGFGLAFAVGALNYELGSARSMGPAYLPLGLGGILVLIGAGVIVEGLLLKEGSPIGPVPWRAIILLVGAVIFFAFTVRRIGLAPSIFITALIAGFSSSRMRILTALLIATAMTVFCVLVFVEALGMPIAVIGPWLRF